MREAYLIAITLSLLTGCSPDEPTPRDIESIGFIEPEYIHVLSSNEHRVWSSQIADLDADGQAELLLLGHENGRHAKACPLSSNPTSPCQSRDFLPPGRDRHGCAVADLNGDTIGDLYCSTGASRGLGDNPNELWLSEGPWQYRKVPSVWGAPEVTARGRKISFLNLNRDQEPDLLTTAFGEREDQADNRSRLWRNTGAHFEPLELTGDETFAHRCHKVVDLNGDGLDDIVGCGGSEGLQVLINSGAESFKPQAIGSDRFYYFALDTAPLSGDVEALAAIGGRRGNMFIEVGELSSNGLFTHRQRLHCALPEEGVTATIYCSDLTFIDYNADGISDLAVSRRRGWLLDEVLGDATDLILLGPTFTSALEIPSTDDGASYQLLPWNNGLIQINAGEGWSGSVRQIQPLN